MKKSIPLGMLGLMAVAAPSFGAGYILLDNYNSLLNPLITYDYLISANGFGGPPRAPGTGLLDGWTVGVYFVIGTPSISDPAGNGMPDRALALGTGTGSTASVYTSAFDTPGEFSASIPFRVGGTDGVTPTITAELVAYPTAAGSYAAAIERGHSAPFVMPSAAVTNPAMPMVGDYFTTFSVIIPEPAIMALASLSGLSLWLMRRRKP